MTKSPPAKAAAQAATLATLLFLGLACPMTAQAQSAQPEPPEPTATKASQAPAAALEDSKTTAAGAGTPTIPQPAPRSDGPLVVVSWGGAYSRSQEEAVIRPFTRATGIKVSPAVYAGGLDQIRMQAAAGKVLWDVVDVDPAEAEAGCSDGLFEKLSFVLPAAPDGTAATDDFLPGTIQPCAIGSLAWSMVIVHGLGSGSDQGDATKPDSLRDFFDLTAFPGGRGLRRTPMANLEWALMADGVAPEAVYDALRSEAGIERAFAKLDSIREAIIWWEDASEPSLLLASGAVAMSSSYNAPIFNEISVRERPFQLIWDGQLWDIDLWAIPAGAPHREAALEFLRFATSTQQLARQTRWIPYGPVRRSSAPLVDDYLYADLKIAPYLPTTPDNLATALRNDAVFWREEGPALVERFNAWLAR